MHMTSNEKENGARGKRRDIDLRPKAERADTRIKARGYDFIPHNSSLILSAELPAVRSIASLNLSCGIRNRIQSRQ